MKEEFNFSQVTQRSWIDYLSEEDMAFLKRFLLASGTLKDLAAQYGVSYPTIRHRLDRLIEKVKVVDSSGDMAHFETTLRSLYADGRMDVEAFRTLLEVYQEEGQIAARSA